MPTANHLAVRAADPKSTRPEPRWPATIAILAIAALTFTLPDRLTLGPSWMIPLVVVALGTLATWSFHSGRHVANLKIGYALLAVITGSLLWSLIALIRGLPTKHQPLELLRSAAALWLSNVFVFASWYWRVDAGGPHARFLRQRHAEGSFLFPQMTLPPESRHADDEWKPGFVDYLFLAFNTSTAFSPTDSPVLTHGTKLLMILQSCISLCTVAILAARAINLL